MSQHKLPPEHWLEAAEQLRQALPRVIKVRDAQRILGYATTSAADYALRQMLELGLVEHVPTGDEKSEWRLT